ncbi:MAG: DUF4040 domain-containing protein [Planctomycetota bacterium]
MIDVFTVDWWTECALLCLVTVTAIGVISVRSLFAATMLSGIYSLLMALVWVNMYSMDVAFTEAAVGAGVSTFLFLGALLVTGTEERPSARLNWKALTVVGITGAALMYGTLDMPPYGSPDAPIHRHVAPEYLMQNVGKVDGVIHDPGERTDFGTHVPNTVTAVLASYRSYDTMFETAVIFTAGLCLILLLRQVFSERREEPTT